MIREWIVSKEVRDVKAAQWEGYRRLAMRLPDHHILAVEAIRTRHDETAAVLTFVRGGEPVQYVVYADAQGRVFPGQGVQRGGGRDAGPGGGNQRDDDGCDDQGAPVQARAEFARVTPAAGGGSGGDGGGGGDDGKLVVDDDGGVSPDTVALGGPPVKQPPSPGAISLATSVLSTIFGVADPSTGANAGANT